MFRKIAAVSFIVFVFAVLGMAFFGTGQISVLAALLVGSVIGLVGVFMSVKGIRTGSITFKENTYTRSGYPFSYWLHCIVWLIVGCIIGFLSMGSLLYSLVKAIE